MAVVMKKTTKVVGVPESHLKKFAHLYENSILVPEAHYRIVDRLPELAAIHGVPEEYIKHSMVEHCSEVEVEWVRDYHKHRENNVAGMVYIGCENSHTRMMYVCGALMRNYIDARVRVVQDIITVVKAGDEVEGKCIAVPNFYRTKGDGGDIARWDSTQLYGWLFKRYSTGLKTILYVQDLQALRADYGDGVYEILTENYVPVTE